jgi:hypothetical protein
MKKSNSICPSGSITTRHWRDQRRFNGGSMPCAPTDNGRVKDKATLIRATLSERDSLHLLALLENPPAANDRLARAARAGFALPLATAADASAVPISGLNEEDIGTGLCFAAVSELPSAIF